MIPKNRENILYTLTKITHTVMLCQNLFWEDVFKWLDAAKFSLDKYDDDSLKALRQPSQKVWAKILTPYFFRSNIYLQFLRPCCENIFKIVCTVSEKLGNKSLILTYCSSLQLVVVYNFSEIKSTFPVPFWDYVANCWWPHGVVSICFVGKSEYDWFLHKTSPWLANFSSIPAAIYLLLKIFCQDKFFYLKSIS